MFCVWLKQGRRQRLWAYALIGLLPFTINAWNLDAAVINWAGWPGYAKGIVITLLDSLALAILATHPAQPRMTPMLGWLLAYLAAVTLSIAFSTMPMASVFYAFQLLRMIVLFLAVARIAADPQALRWIAYGLSAAITFEAGVALSQKAGGALQAAGTMGHQNLLGLMTHFVLLPLLALLFSGERSKIVMLGVFASLVAIALSASRGALLFSGGGIAVLFALTLARRSTAHKWRMLGFGVLMLALSAPLAYRALENRFVEQGTQSGAGAERAAFERAAKAMWSDHPMGVGANTYVVVANTQGYSDRGGVNWSSGRSTNVHNAYLLAAAETGWLGLIAFAGMIGAAIFTGLRFAFADRRAPEGEIVLGCTVAWIAVAGHNFYEWVFVMYQAQYVAAISLGVMAGLVRARRAQRRRARRAVMASYASDVPSPSAG